MLWQIGPRFLDGREIVRVSFRRPFFLNDHLVGLPDDELFIAGFFGPCCSCPASGVALPVKGAFSPPMMVVENVRFLGGVDKLPPHVVRLQLSSSAARQDLRASRFAAAFFHSSRRPASSSPSATNSIRRLSRNRITSKSAHRAQQLAGTTHSLRRQREHRMFQWIGP